MPALDKVFTLMGYLLIIEPGNGPSFNGTNWQEYCRRMGIRHKSVTPYWPQANGQSESFMRSMKKIVKNSKVSGSDWRQEANRFLRNYRATPHSATKMAPSDLILTPQNYQR